MLEFDLVYADPPWKYTDNGTARVGYPMMSEEELKAFPIGDLLRPRYGPGKRKGSYLFIWVTCPHILGMQARILMHWAERYKLHYRGMPFVWVKTQKSDPSKIIGGTGVRANTTKPGVEMVVAFSNCKTGRPVPMISEKPLQMILEPEEIETDVVAVPRNGHSTKPREVVDRIDAMYGGNCAKIELFARGKVKKGWRGWGDECQDSLAWPV